MRTEADIKRSIGVIERAHAEGRTPTHRETYPEQYSHPRIGQTCMVVIKGKVKARGEVTRVIGSMYGQLVEIDNNSQTFWRLSDCDFTD